MEKLLTSLFLNYFATIKWPTQHLCCGLDGLQKQNYIAPKLGVKIFKIYSKAASNAASTNNCPSKYKNPAPQTTPTVAPTIIEDVLSCVLT